MNLNQVTIPVLDIEAAIAFYEKLGLQLIVKSLPEYARFLCPAGQSTFSLHRVGVLPKGEGIWIYFEVENINKTVQDIQSKEIVFETLPTAQPWLWTEASLKDIDNNHIIIYHAGNNRINPPWRIK